MERRRARGLLFLGEQALCESREQEESDCGSVSVSY